MAAPADRNRSFSVLKEFIEESIRGVYYLGLKSSSLDDIKKICPAMYDYLCSNYQEFLSDCIVAMKSVDGTTRPIPYVLLPDGLMTVVSWDHTSGSPTYPQSEDLARSIERFA